MNEISMHKEGWREGEREGGSKWVLGNLGRRCTYNMSTGWREPFFYPPLKAAGAVRHLVHGNALMLFLLVKFVCACFLHTNISDAPN